MPQLNKGDLCRLLPHAGAMCLLDAVEDWNERTIHCRATSHRDPQHPLRHRGQLDAVAGLEYAAQAMGVHVGLLNSARSTGGLIGYVGGVNEVTLAVPRLESHLVHS